MIAILFPVRGHNNKGDAKLALSRDGSSCLSFLWKWYINPMNFPNMTVIYLQLFVLTNWVHTIRWVMPQNGVPERMGSPKAAFPSLFMNGPNIFLSFFISWRPIMLLKPRSLWKWTFNPESNQSLSRFEFQSWWEDSSPDSVEKNAFSQMLSPLGVIKISVKFKNLHEISHFTLWYLKKDSIW